MLDDYQICLWCAALIITSIITGVFYKIYFPSFSRHNKTVLLLL